MAPGLYAPTRNEVKKIIDAARSALVVMTLAPAFLKLLTYSLSAGGSTAHSCMRSCLPARPRHRVRGVLCFCQAHSPLFGRATSSQPVHKRQANMLLFSSSISYITSPVSLYLPMYPPIRLCICASAHRRARSSSSSERRSSTRSCCARSAATSRSRAAAAAAAASAAAWPHQGTLTASADLHLSSQEL